MTAITIRAAQHQDIYVLRTMERSLIKAERPYDPTIKKGPINYYDLEALMLDPKANIVVACEGDRIVACGYAIEKAARPYLDHETYAYLGFMFTENSHRGRGINAMIIAELKHWCSTQGLHELRLTVYEANLPAVAAYEKVGFKRHIAEMRMRI